MRLTDMVALGVAALWAISYIVSVANNDFTGFQTATTVMLIAGSWLLSTRKKNGKG